MSLNLHAIVRPAINMNKQDLPFTVYRSIGQKNVRGVITAYYSKQVGYMGQIQSEGDSALYHAELGTQSTITRKIYLYAPDDLKTRVWSVYRKQSRSGDFIQDNKGQLWLVTAVLEDFSEVGWESVRVTLQQSEVKILDENGNDLLKEEEEEDQPNENGNNLLATEDQTNE